MKEYFTRTRFENNKYIVEQVEQTSFDVELLQPQKATITHIGAYGQIQFVVNGVSYQTENGNISKRMDTKNVFVNTENLVFDKDPKELMRFVFINRENGEYWVKVPSDWKRCPEDWTEIPNDANQLKTGDILLNSNNKEIVVESIYHSGCVTATNGYRYDLTGLRGYKSL